MKNMENKKYELEEQDQNKLERFFKKLYWYYVEKNETKQKEELKEFAKLFGIE